MIETNRILCPVDFSPFSERALAYAMKMAMWHGARVRVLHVMPPLPPSVVNALAATSRDLSARNLQQAVERQSLPGVDVDTELVESADIAARIVESAEAFDADLIVTGSHGRSGMQRVVLGSVVEALLHRCARPVLVVPSHVDQDTHGSPISLSQIVCAVDFAEPSLAAIEYALPLASETDAHLTLLHVIEIPPELQTPPQPPDYDIAPIRAKAEAECLARLANLIPEHARDYCTVETAVLEGGVPRQLLRMAAARHADLIVLGVHGRNAFDLAFFGSNSKDVIRQAHCPVLIVPMPRRARTLRAVS